MGITETKKNMPDFSVSPHQNTRFFRKECLAGQNVRMGVRVSHSDILEHIEITGGLGGGVGLTTLPEWGAGPPS